MQKIIRKIFGAPSFYVHLLINRLSIHYSSISPLTAINEDAIKETQDFFAILTSFRCNYSLNTVSLLLSLINNYSNIKTIDLTHLPAAELDDNFAPLLAIALKYNTQASKFVLNPHNFTYINIQHIVAALKFNISIKTLDLTLSNDGTFINAPKNIALLLQHLSQMPSINSLTLSNNTINTLSSSHNIDATTLHFITTLNITDIFNASSIELLEKFLTKNSTITVLNISNSNLDNANIATSLLNILQKNRSLTTISLQRCNIVDTTIEILSQFLKIHPRTIELDVSYNNISTIGLKLLLYNLSDIHNNVTLNISNNLIGINNPELLKDTFATNTAVTAISLQDNKIHDFAPLANAIAANHCIEHLELSAPCKVDNNAVVNFQAFTQVLIHDTYITHLTVDIEYSNLDNLLEAVGQNNSLISIKIKTFIIPFEALSKALARNHSLVSLEFVPSNYIRFYVIQDSIIFIQLQNLYDSIKNNKFSRLCFLKFPLTLRQIHSSYGLRGMHTLDTDINLGHEPISFISMWFARSYFNQLYYLLKHRRDYLMPNALKALNLRPVNIPIKYNEEDILCQAIRLSDNSIHSLKQNENQVIRNYPKTLFYYAYKKVSTLPNYTTAISKCSKDIQLSLALLELGSKTRPDL